MPFQTESIRGFQDSHGALVERVHEYRRVLREPPPPAWPVEPWIQNPPEGRTFRESAGIAIPAAATSTTVLSVDVPFGWDGLMASHANLFTGTGFFEGSGEITWRLQVGRVYVRDCEAIVTTIGSFSTPFPLVGAGVRVFSGQRILYTVTVTAAGIGHLDPAGRIVCMVGGWFYPRRPFYRGGAI